MNNLNVPKPIAIKDNASRTERTIDNLDDRQDPNTNGGEAGVAGPGTPGHGRRMPQFQDDIDVVETTLDVNKRPLPKDKG